MHATAVHLYAMDEEGSAYPGHVCFRIVHAMGHTLDCTLPRHFVRRGTALIPPGCRMRGLLASALSTRDASTQSSVAAVPSVVSSGVQTMLVPADVQAGLQGTRQSQAGGDSVDKVLVPVACTHPALAPLQLCVSKLALAPSACSGANVVMHALVQTAGVCEGA